MLAAVLIVIRVFNPLSLVARTATASHSAHDENEKAAEGEIPEDVLDEGIHHIVPFLV